MRRPERHDAEDETLRLRPGEDEVPVREHFHRLAERGPVRIRDPDPAPSRQDGHRLLRRPHLGHHGHMTLVVSPGEFPCLPADDPPRRRADGLAVGPEVPAPGSFGDAPDLALETTIPFGPHHEKAPGGPGWTYMKKEQESGSTKRRELEGPGDAGPHVRIGEVLAAVQNHGLPPVVGDVHSGGGERHGDHARSRLTGEGAPSEMDGDNPPVAGIQNLECGSCDDEGWRSETATVGCADQGHLPRSPPPWNRGKGPDDGHRPGSDPDTRHQEEEHDRGEHHAGCSTPRHAQHLSGEVYAEGADPKT